MSKRNRRQFLEDSMFATAAAVAASSSGQLFAQEEKQSSSPNERLNVVVVGVNGRGGSHIGAFAHRKDTRITHVCDVDRTIGGKRAEEIGKKQEGFTPKMLEDLRKVLEDKDVNIVSIATPNHTHSILAIWAMLAGKDVYVEKPVSHNVAEGRRAVQVARKHNKICQTGTQSRSNPGMRDAIAFIHAGKIGDVKLARGLCYKPRGSIGAKGEYKVPEGVNYDLWCGPSQMLPLTRPKFHYDWHWQWEWGNGDLGNQGIHQMDIARWGLGVDQLSDKVISYGGRVGYEDAGETANTQVIMHEFGDKTLTFEVRGLKTGDYRGAKVGVIFEGSEGYVVLPSYNGGAAFDKDGKMIAEFKGGDDKNHFENFLKGVRSRKSEDLNADISEGHLSSALCHTGNISYRLGETATPAMLASKLEAHTTNDKSKETLERTIAHLKDNGVDIAKTPLAIGPLLAMDPKSETFPGNEAANKMLSRQNRKGYEIPSESDI
ncbi:Gfo/Idh/MocA family protein [Anatilimnocola sp. NA78]|uniref:Gfo/Idh/MocA family protein n=1 Tax=Anatilimnocola sp. NA78 TaxID=3415683 RepID=UPI003CE5956A